MILVIIILLSLLSNNIFGCEAAVGDSEHNAYINSLIADDAEEVEKVQVEVIKAKSDVFNF